MSDLNDQTVVTTETATTPSAPLVESTAALPGESAVARYERLYPSVSATGAPVATLPPEVLAHLQQMQTELTALRTQQVSSSPKASDAGPEWIEKIRSGDFAGAEAAMARRIEESLQPKLEAVKQQAYNDALNASQVNTEVDRFLTQVRQDNPDIIPFERYLQGPVSERIQIAQQAGRIKSSQDFLREYRAAVDGEVTSLRQRVQTVRASGKDDALTRVVSVQHSTPLTPQQVQSNQTQTTSQQNLQPESNDEYFAKRRADESRRRGL